MRTTVDLNDKLLSEAKAALQTRTKKETIERALQETVRRKRIQALLDRQGKGFGITLRDLSRMRRDE